MSGVNRIVLKGEGHRDELVAGTAISPGMGITVAADGEVDPCVPAQAAALKGGLMIAEEDPLQGSIVTTEYAIGAQVSTYVPVPGDVLQLLVKSGEDIDVADLLIIEGGTSGLFVEAAGTETKFQAESLEDTGGALGANGLVRARIL